MFERFNHAARHVIVLAQEEAREFNHHSIDTQHLLLGVLRVRDGVAASALASLGIGYDVVLARVEDTYGRGAEPTPSHIPFTEAAKKAVEHSLEESLELRHNYIGAEHILLALVRDQNDASRMLADLGADAHQVRERVLS